MFEAPRSNTSQYCIHPGYRHRKRSRFCDDSSWTDEWQLEVYLAAAELMRSKGLRTVYDIGCGSGYKLVHYLGEYDTTGFDVEKAIPFLKQRYPERKWSSVAFTETRLPPADLVVCSDVIEHVEDPDALLKLLQRVSKHYLVLSTPDRNLSYPEKHRRRMGPPHNPTHIREWTFQEFKSCVGKSFNIVEHRISNGKQATQLIVCQNRP
jgi:SAM-dependent methyltransferase